MRTGTNWVLIGGGTLGLGVAAVLAAMVSARHQCDVARMRQEQELAAAGGDVPRSPAESVLQLPAIHARPDAEGVVVTLRNDSSDQRVFLNAARDRLVLEYTSVAAGPVVRTVRLRQTATLAPGEAGEPLHVPIEGRWNAMTVRFEHREDMLTACTEAKLP